MPSTERIKNILQNIVKSPNKLPCRVIIPSSHVDLYAGKPIEAFVAHQHYFQVRINEMYLAYSREWVNDYSPMVFAISEYDYGFPQSETQTVPYVVGPTQMAKKFNMPFPDDMVFTNKTVAGLHPYRGGAIRLTVTLYKIKTQDRAQQLLHLVENAASVIDVSTTFNIYLKVADIVLDGIESLFGLNDTTIPLLSWDNTFDPNANDRLEPHYAALIDLPESSIDPNTLWVCDNQLKVGKSCTESKPFREANYVLYSLVQTSERNDISRLSFMGLYEEMIRAAQTKGDYRRATALMTTLATNLILCPDLTKSQNEALENEYREEMQRLGQKQVKGTRAGAGDYADLSELEQRLRDTVHILDV